MATLKDRLLDPTNPLVAQSTLAPVANGLIYGQNGPLLQHGRYMNTATDISRPAFCRVVEFPRWIEFMPDPKPYRQAIKAFFEIHTKFDGLQKGLNADFHEQEIGAAGHKQFDVTKTTITQSEITHSMTDFVGLPFQNLLAQWIRFGMMDPESWLPLITTMRDDVTDMLPDMYSATLLYVVPDARFQRAQKAWLITNAAPRNNGPDEARRDITQPGQPTELSIPFTGLQDTSYGVLQFAQEEMDRMTRSGLNPILRKAFVDKIDAAVSATAGGWLDRLKQAEKEQAA